MKLVTPDDFIGTRAPPTPVPQPRNGFVLIRREPRAEKTEQGIFIPGDAGILFETAMVVAVGPGSPADSGARISDTADLRVGQRVLVQAAVGKQRPGRIPGTATIEPSALTLPFQVDGETAELIPQHLILAILNEPNNNQEQISNG